MVWDFMKMQRTGRYMGALLKLKKNISLLVTINILVDNQNNMYFLSRVVNRSLHNVEQVDQTYISWIVENKSKNLDPG